jgi:hypothetical protein
MRLGRDGIVCDHCRSCKRMLQQVRVPDDNEPDGWRIAHVCWRCEAERKASPQERKP